MGPDGMIERVRTRALVSPRRNSNNRIMRMDQPQPLESQELRKRSEEKPCSLGFGNHMNPLPRSFLVIKGTPRQNSPTLLIALHLIIA